MSISSSFLQPSARRFSLADERFPVLTPTSVSASESRLQRPAQPMFLKTHDVATSVSSSGWIAASSSDQIRLYNVREAIGEGSRNRKIPPVRTLSIALAKNEEFRAIALSEDLLAVITHDRLLVYDEYRTSPDLARNRLDSRSISQTQTWTPKSVAILQTGTASEGAMASIAVGGEGENGVKVFKYMYTSGWNAENDRPILRCPQNNGAIKVVGFSPPRSDAISVSMVFALTTGNRLFCWAVGGSLGPSGGSLNPCWHFDCNSTSNERTYRDEITSAAFIVSPTGSPYILCTVENRPGSHLHSTFIVAIDVHGRNPYMVRQGMKPIPDTVVGPSVLTGIASSSGRFLVVMEKGKKSGNMKLLTVQGAPDGGLTCVAAQMQTWEAKLQGSGTDTSTISMSIREEQGILEIIAVDGRGHVVSSKVRVPGLTAFQPAYRYPRSPRSPTSVELQQNVIMRELSSDESSRASIATSHHATDRRDIIPG
ncbi:hypothetical protein BDW02DRAFT_640001 [Decorospora gaudefroyi]|uniref:WD40 repeat-like protein n=1 Tax=Decorospora gaudefroyi TaxID=184978 RepID=A0A6A5KCI3_9PLEO|nr:hypothetical protein BDW02DRAFT_640001 [Decorospora gaudefroyi]